MKTDPHKFIVIKASHAAGLGDRLRTLICGIGYARLSGRTIFVDWSDGLLADAPENSFPRLFHLTGLPHTGDCPQGSDVAPPAWRDHLDKPFSALVQYYYETIGREWNRDEAFELYSIDVQKTYDDSIVVLWDFEQFGHIHERFLSCPKMCHPWDRERTAFRTLFEQHVRISASIHERIQQFEKQYFQPDTIGVHIRATHEGSTRFVSLNVIDSHLDALMSGNAQRPIFVSTDNKEIYEYLAARYPNVATTTKWYPKSWEPMHLSEDRPDKLINAEEALIDLILLSRCPTLLYSGTSSFSQVAAMLSSASPSQQFCLTPTSQYVPSWRRHWRRYRAWLRGGQ